MTKEKVKTIRDGQEVALNPEELVLGDVIRLSAGEQIPSDALVLEGFAEVNEAMLTGKVIWCKRKWMPCFCREVSSKWVSFRSGSPCWGQITMLPNSCWKPRQLNQSTLVS